MRSAVLPALAFALCATPALAKDKDEVPAPPPVFQAVVDCKALTDAAQRLACYDRTVEAMAAASRAKDLAVFDRTTMREARRGIFGLSLPRLKLFGGGDSEEVMEIDSTISAVRRAPDGMPIMILADGARWKQTDGRNVFPKSGDAIHIRRAAMGSFMANVAKQPGVRVTRLAN